MISFTLIKFVLFFILCFNIDSCLDFSKQKSMLTSDETRKKIGINLSLNSILNFFFGVQKLVITTKSVEYMPLSISLCSFANSLCWTVYALVQIDPYILVTILPIPNILCYIT